MQRASSLCVTLVLLVAAAFCESLCQTSMDPHIADSCSSVAALYRHQVQAGLGGRWHDRLEYSGPGQRLPDQDTCNTRATWSLTTACAGRGALVVLISRGLSLNVTLDFLTTQVCFVDMQEAYFPTSLTEYFAQKGRQKDILFPFDLSIVPP